MPELTPGLTLGLTPGLTLGLTPGLTLGLTPGLTLEPTRGLTPEYQHPANAGSSGWRRVFWLALGISGLAPGVLRLTPVSAGYRRELPAPPSTSDWRRVRPAGVEYARLSPGASGCAEYLRLASCTPGYRRVPPAAAEYLRLAPGLSVRTARMRSWNKY
ncbi:hypothetical protein [Kribbella sp. NPDC003557]|uniref:hypothetical protein n=1 Tax=Kribbella sp. NPDC003557 TaxID=3154449 RepID=UPI0033ABE65D